MTRQLTSKIIASDFKKLLRKAKTLLQAAFDRCIADVNAKPKRGVLSFAIAGLFFWWYGVVAGLLWFLFLLFSVYEWDNRIIGVLALLALASCPVLLSFRQDVWAETMAVYAYFFLVMTVALQIVEYKRHPDEYAED